MAFNEDELIEIQRIILEKRKQDLIDEIEVINEYIRRIDKL